MHTQEQQIQEMDAATSSTYRQQFWKALLAALLSGVLWLTSAEWSHSALGLAMIFGLGALIGGVAYLAGAAWMLFFIRTYARLPTAFLYEFRSISEVDTWKLVSVLMVMAALGLSFCIGSLALFFDFGLAWALGSPMLGQLVAFIVFGVDFVNNTIDKGEGPDCCF